MKNILILALSLLFFQGCSIDTSEQIEGIVWIDNYSKLGNSQAYTRFINGKVHSCVKNEGKWNAVTSYEINGNKLTVLPDDKNKGKKVFNVKVKTGGETRVLIMSREAGDKKLEMTFPVSNTTDCPIS